MVPTTSTGALGGISSRALYKDLTTCGREEIECKLGKSNAEGADATAAFTARIANAPTSSTPVTSESKRTMKAGNSEPHRSAGSNICSKRWEGACSSTLQPRRSGRLSLACLLSPELALDEEDEDEDEDFSPPHGGNSCLRSLCASSSDGFNNEDMVAANGIGFSSSTMDMLDIKCLETDDARLAASCASSAALKSSSVTWMSSPVTSILADWVYTCGHARRMLAIAAWLQRFWRSAPLLPAVCPANLDRNSGEAPPTPGSREASGHLRVTTSSMCRRWAASGGGKYTSRSRRPGRLSAASKRSGRLVAARMATLPRASNPSMQASNVVTIAL
mmetsp:Transcript_37485/g.87768  ORF Transcript_37485/g.87768 Transcript_37485/m.87768 type:complete len:333 (-) Transcript_37485:671-1669(-)